MRRIMRKLLIVTLLLLPIPSWAQPPEVMATLRTQRAAKPTPMSKAQLADMLNRTALAHPGWGMLRKDGGNVCPTPYADITIACDWLVNNPTRWGYDVLRDSENTAGVVESGGSALSAGQEFVPPWPSGQQPQDPDQSHTGLTLEQVRTVVHDEMQTIWVQNERIFANVLDNLNAIQGKQDAFSDQLKLHDEKTSALVGFFKDPKTITALISGVLAYFTATKMN